MRRTIVAAAVLSSAFPAFAASAQRSCQVDAVDAVGRARDAGFVFRILATDATRCELSESTVIVSAPLARPASCQFIMFGGRPLKAGWRPDRLQISATPVSQVSILTPPSRNGWILRITSPRGQTARVSVRKVIVRGANCAVALLAFD